MKAQSELVAEFRKAFDLPSNTGIENITQNEIALEERMLSEELYELVHGLSMKDNVEAADGIIDMMYLLHGLALKIGIADKLEALFNEVHYSNMSKLGADGKRILDVYGKVQKGPGYFKPDLACILNEKNK